jgi:hypothetical protein
MRLVGSGSKLVALIRRPIAAIEAVCRGIGRAGSSPSGGGLVFEGTAILVKEMAPSAPGGARETVVTFRVHRALAVPAPKYVVLEARIPSSSSYGLRPGASYLVRAAAEDRPPADEFAVGLVASLRDPRIELLGAEPRESAAA